MRMSGQPLDTAPMLRRLLQVFSVLGFVGFISVGLWYDSTHPSRVERVVACFEKLGYSTNVVHDDGREPNYLFGGEAQVRTASNQVTALLPGGLVATITVLDGDGMSRNTTTFSHGVPRTASRRAAVADCANP